MTICIVVNGKRFQNHAVTLTLIGQCPMSNSSELFSCTTICLSFKWTQTDMSTLLLISRNCKKLAEILQISCQYLYLKFCKDYSDKYSIARTAFRPPKHGYHI